MAKIIKKSQNANVSTNGKGKLGRKPMDPKETPAMRFERLAGARLGRALQSLKGLRSLTARCPENVKDRTVAEGQKTGVYFDKGQWEFILGELNKGFSRLNKALQNGGPGANKNTVNIPKLKK